jgi:hypothetical protein
LFKCWEAIRRIGTERAKFYASSDWPPEPELSSGLELAARGFRVHVGSTKVQPAAVLRFYATTKAGDTVRAEQFGVTIDFQQ